jgi:hypothetical protein
MHLRPLDGLLWRGPLDVQLPRGLAMIRQGGAGHRRPAGGTAVSQVVDMTTPTPAFGRSRPACPGKEGARLKEAPGRKYSEHREACSPWGRARAIMVSFGAGRKLV